MYLSTAEIIRPSDVVRGASAQLETSGKERDDEELCTPRGVKVMTMVTIINPLVHGLDAYLTVNLQQCIQVS